MKKHHALFVPIALVISLVVLQNSAFSAENASPSGEMQNLNSSQQYIEAYELGLKNRDEWEGEPNFDFQFGLAALETGNPNEPVFALERAAATSPDAGLRSLARLELARAYFVTNNLTASENLFNAVLATNPPYQCSAKHPSFFTTD